MDLKPALFNTALQALTLKDGEERKHVNTPLGADEKPYVHAGIFTTMDYGAEKAAILTLSINDDFDDKYRTVSTEDAKKAVRETFDTLLARSGLTLAENPDLFDKTSDGIHWDNTVTGGRDILCHGMKIVIPNMKTMEMMRSSAYTLTAEHPYAEVPREAATPIHAQPISQTVTR